MAGFPLFPVESLQEERSMIWSKARPHPGPLPRGEGGNIRPLVCVMAASTRRAVFRRMVEGRRGARHVRTCPPRRRQSPSPGGEG